jgi:hypothetical protein
MAGRAGLLLAAREGIEEFVPSWIPGRERQYTRWRETHGSTLPRRHRAALSYSSVHRPVDCSSGGPSTRARQSDTLAVGAAAGEKDGWSGPSFNPRKPCLIASQPDSRAFLHEHRAIQTALQRLNFMKIVTVHAAPLSPKCRVPHPLKLLSCSLAHHQLPASNHCSHREGTNRQLHVCESAPQHRRSKEQQHCGSECKNDDGVKRGPPATRLRDHFPGLNNGCVYLTCTAVRRSLACTASVGPARNAGSPPRPLARNEAAGG